MNFKREAIDKLRCYTAKQESIRFTEDQIKELEMEFGNIQSAMKDGTPVSGGTNQREERLINNIALRVEIKAAQEQTREWLRIMDTALGTLSQEERRILDLMYIHRAKGNVERLCAEFNIEKPTVYRWKDSALRRFSMALYGVTEN